MSDLPTTRLKMFAARTLWIGIALLALAVWAGGVPARSLELKTPCDEQICPPLALTTAEIDLLQDTRFSVQGYTTIQVGIEVISILTYVIPSILIFWRRSNDRVGFLFSLGLIMVGTSVIVQADDAAQRVFNTLTVSHGLLNTLSMATIMILFIFPDGRFVPGWTRYFMGIWLMLLTGTFIESRGDLNAYYGGGEYEGIGFAFTMAILLLGAFAQIYRYRNVSDPTERQQTKWVVLGITAMVAGITTWILFIEAFPQPPGMTRILVNLVLVPVVSIFNLVFPLTVMLAILRYRLYDIDIIIRRTIQYALVTGILALTYFGGIVILQGILGPITGSENSPVVTAITTLGIAALFNPLRNRIQDFIDQRFYRAKYDAEKTLANFAETARDEVDMEKLSAALLGVVDDTMQPSQVSLWLKNDRLSRKTNNDF